MAKNTRNAEYTKKYNRNLFLRLLRMEPMSQAEIARKMGLTRSAVSLITDELIREIAEEDSCVFVGRCADYVLRDEPSLFRIFIYGDLDHRQERVKERHPELKSSQIIDVINKTDKRRASYYNFYTGNKWGKYDNYDIAINSSTLGIDGAAELICASVKKLMEN